MTLSDRLKALLLRQGYTISSVAELAGMDRRQVHAITSGKNDNPGVKTLERIVEASGATLGDLFADSE